MTFERWIKGHENRMNKTYTERELELMRWIFDVGGMKAQPLGTYVEYSALIPECIYENMEVGMIIKVNRNGELFTPTKRGLEPVDPVLENEFKKCTFMRVK